jgi:hypothetical protein
MKRRCRSTADHFVEGAGQGGKLVAAAEIQSSTQIGFANGAGSDRNGRYGPHGSISQPKPAKKSNSERSQAAECQGDRETMLLAAQIAGAAQHEIAAQFIVVPNRRKDKQIVRGRHPTFCAGNRY